MKKTFIILALFSVLVLFASAQKSRPVLSPTKKLTGQNALGYCNVEFYYDNTLVYTANTDHYNTLAFMKSFSSSYDNKINNLKYYGTRCFLWIELFKNTNFGGVSIGFWVAKGSGSFNLNDYNTYDQSSGWSNWGKSISSVTVYYY